MQSLFIHFPSPPPSTQAPPNGYTVAIATVPASRGWLRLASADPTAPPLINPNYLAEGSDVRRLLLGVSQARELSTATAFAEWGPRFDLVCEPGLDLRGQVGLSGWRRGRGWPDNRRHVSLCAR
jgi:choline dehydrogenase